MRPFAPLVLTGTLCATALPLAAEVAPDALWQDWQAGTGRIAAMAGSAGTSGDDVTVDGAALRIGSGEAAPVLRAERLTLRADGEATRVALPGTFTLTAAGAEYRVTAPGLSLTVSGDVADPTYRVAGPEVDVATDALPLASGPASLQVAAQDLDLVYTGEGGTLQAATLSAALGDAAGTPAVSGTRTNLNATLDGTPEALAVPGSGPFAILVTSAAATQEMVFDGPEGEALTVTLDTGPTREELSSDGTTTSLRQSYVDLAGRLDGPVVPIPEAAMQIGAATLGATMPSVAGPDDAPVSLDLALRDVTVDEQLWQFFDPAGVLPRSPAQVVLSMTGEAALAEDPPAFRRLALDRLEVSALDANARGSGAVQFVEPPSAERPFGQPVGSAALTLTGVTELIDRLSGLGTLPEGQLMGARLGLGFFTRPGTEPGTLETNLTVGPDGVLTINGQPVARIP